MRTVNPYKIYPCPLCCEVPVHGYLLGVVILRFLSVRTWTLHTEKPRRVSGKVMRMLARGRTYGLIRNRVNAVQRFLCYNFYKLKNRAAISDKGFKSIITYKGLHKRQRDEYTRCSL